MANQTVYSSYSQAKEILKELNGVIADPSPDRINQFNQKLKDFFQKDAFFKAYYNNIFYQKVPEDKKPLLSQSENPERLQIVRQAILSFIYNVLGAPQETTANLPPKEILNKINETVIDPNNQNAEQAATTLIPSLKKQVENAQRIWQDKLMAEKVILEETPKSLENLVYKQLNENVLKAVQDHVAAGGKLDDPYRGQAIAREVGKNPLIATYVSEKKLAKTIEEVWSLKTVAADQILASYVADQLEAQTELPTAGQVAENIQTVAQSLNISLDAKQTTDLLHEIEKTIAAGGKDISTTEAITQGISQYFKKAGISSENLTVFVEKISPAFNTYRKGVEALIPKGAVSERIRRDTSIACQKIREATADFSLKKAFSWFTVLRNADLNVALPDFNIHVEKRQKLGAPTIKNLNHRLKEFKVIFKVSSDNKISLPPSQGKLSPADFIHKPISVVGRFGGIFSRIPGLKGFGGFLQKFTPANIKTRLGGRLLRSSLFKFAAQNIAKKGLKGLFSKGVMWLGGKLAGKGIGTLVGTAVGGPVGTAVGFVASIVIDKAIKRLKSLFSKENLKKLGKILLGALTFGIGLLGGLLSALGGAALTIGGIGMTALGIMTGQPLLIAGGLGLTAAGLWKSTIQPALAKAGNALQAGIKPFIHSLSTGWGGATIPSYIALSPAIAVAATAGVTLISYMTLISAFAIPPSGAEVGMPMGKVDFVDYSSSHPADKIADIVEQYAGGQLNQNTWHLAEEYLKSALSPEAFEELRHSVFGIAGNSNAQCVGAKITAEKELGIDFPRQNAVDFLTNHPGCTIVWQRNNPPLSYQNLNKTFDEKYGLVAVWGPKPGCNPGQNCSNNILCCGHIGNITKIEQSPVPNGIPRLYITAAFGESGAVGTSIEPADGPDMILKCN